MKKILIASTNQHKIKEIGHILGVPVEGRGLNTKENGNTFEANAIKKAKAVAKKFGAMAVADDSGLMVNCLNGAPGVRSARFASPPTPENLCRKLLKKMENCKARGAHFVCAIALAYPSGKIRVFKGACYGRITREMRGRHGFGYDAVFRPCGFKNTFAEMTPAAKNRISHRARALKKLKNSLNKKTRAREDSNLRPTD